LYICIELLWKAPEQLRNNDNLAAAVGGIIQGSKSADIYTLALIITEVINMWPCWENHDENEGEYREHGEEEEENEDEDGEDESVPKTSRHRNGRRNQRAASNPQRPNADAGNTRRSQQQRRQGQNAAEILYLVRF
jgi:hypothetical protein